MILTGNKNEVKKIIFEKIRENRYTILRFYEFCE